MMYLKDITKLIYKPNTVSEDRHITVKLLGTDKVLWEGRAKDLRNMPNIKGWDVVEILIDWTDNINPVDYNKGKIIMVI